MANGIRTGDPRGFNKGRSSKFRVGSEFDKHLKKAGGHIGRNIMEITIKMKTKVLKPLMIKNKRATQTMDHRKMKVMTIHKALNPKDAFDRSLYVSTKGRRATNCHSVLDRHTLVLTSLTLSGVLASFITDVIVLDWLT